MLVIKHHKGFTLVELLTVIAIVAVLGAILIPTVSKMKTQANAVEGTNNLRNIGTALNLYAADADGYLPRVSIKKSEWNADNPDDQVTADQMWSKLLRDYLPQQSLSKTSRAHKVFGCPNAEYYDSSGRIVDKDDISLSYTATEAIYGIRILSTGPARDSKSQRHLSTIEEPSNTVIVTDGKQQSTAYTSCRSSTVWSQLLGDIQTNPESASYIDFRQPGQSANVLYVDGHVGRLSFDEFQELDEQDWTGRPQS
ncbi:type II secretion system protein [Rubellicoccus peritrichatus]|uniref:Type II secretion system protein n=1 Tax=Rubellicoccus peritrichatus TaxID=3080537 RepID=A0AAQ3L8E7_9BACT|nr:type II secretion system protein [Puniceicoccus sp. CR14]WOO41225.1 type II secretion system protein [Puniceicoccus sp. CR14]